MGDSERAILVQADVGQWRVPGNLVIAVTASGQTTRYTLVDDGSVPGDKPMDGLWTAHCPVGSSRFVDLELTVLNASGSSTLYHRVISAPAEDFSVDFYLESTDNGVVAHRVLWLPTAGDDDYFGNALALTLALGWGLLVLAYVALLVVAGRKR